MKAHDGPTALSGTETNTMRERLRAIIDAGMPPYRRITEDWHEETAQRVVESHERWRRVDRDRFGEHRA